MLEVASFSELFRFWDFPLICIVACLCFGVAAFRYNSEATDMKLLSVSTIVGSIYIFCDAFLCAVQNGLMEYSHSVVYAAYVLMSVMGFSIAAVWMGVINVFFGDRVSLVEKIFYFFAGAAFLASLVFCKTDLFIVDLDGKGFEIGYLDYLWYFADFIPLGYVLFRAIAKTREKDAILYRERTVPIIIIMIFQLIVSILQIPFASTPIIGLSFSFSIGIVFIYRIQSDVSKDELTGLGNRRELYRDLNQKLNDDNKEVSHYLVIFDLDRFKNINDGYGHNEGDVALQTAGSLAYEVCQKNEAMLYRYGGDEFIILKSIKRGEVDSEEKEIRALITTVEEHMKIHNALSKAPYKLEATFGFSGFGGESRAKDSITKVIERADKMLYAGKQAKKKGK